jgi:hypothetical protein
MKSATVFDVATRLQNTLYRSDTMRGFISSGVMAAAMQKSNPDFNIRP